MTTLASPGPSPGPTAPRPRYVHGAVDVPLLGETVGQNLDRTAARVPDSLGPHRPQPEHPLDLQ